MYRAQKSTTFLTEPGGVPFFSKLLFSKNLFCFRPRKSSLGNIVDRYPLRNRRVQEGNPSTMDAASVQEILAAIRAVIASNATATTAAAQAATAATDAANAATNAVTAHAGGGGGATVNTDTSPYSGNALDLGSKIGSTLYFQASKPLGTLFTSKPETFFLFLQDLTERVEECQWNSSTHNILTISKGNPAVTYDIIGDYGRLTLQDVNTAREAREAGTDDRAKQNARQLYICLYASCDELTKSRMLSNDLKRDGPTLLIHMLKSTFTANFQHAQATRLELQ